MKYRFLFVHSLDLSIDQQMDTSLKKLYPKMKRSNPAEAPNEQSL